MNQKSKFDIQETIGDAIIHEIPSVVLSEGTLSDDVRKAIRIFMRKHPEIFWFSHQYSYDENKRELNLRYNFTPQKRDFFKAEIDKAVKCLFQPEKLLNLSELNKVACVYKWIASNTTYNEYSSFNQTIYSVLINRNSVCTGYAKTAQYLLGLLGVESHLVFGKFHSDKSDKGRHGWNIVRIDGIWYHVDFCLADPLLKHLLNPYENPIIVDGVMWNYFCKSTDTILKNRSIEFIDKYPCCPKNIYQTFRIRLSSPPSQSVVCKSDSGTCAKVYLDSYDKNRVIKVARNDHALIENEKNILSLLQGCNHIVRLKGQNENGIILEQLTPWSELLNSHYYHPNERQLTDILLQLAQGLIECRDKGITYTDIHYNNIFVSKDGTYKWGDFGIAYPSKPDGSLPQNMIGCDGIPLGSKWFMAPETYNNRIFTESSAIYCLAMIAYFVMNDMYPPFLSSEVTEQESLDKRLSFSIINPPINSRSYTSLSQIVCNILNAQPWTRTKTFEEFIALLESKTSITPSLQSDVMAYDSNSDGCADIANNSGIIRTADNNSIVEDYDSFAMTRLEANITKDKPLDYDPDSFACTCRISPSAGQYPDHRYSTCSPTPEMPKGKGSSTDIKTTYAPAKSKIDPQETDPSKSKTGRRSLFSSLRGLFAGKDAKATDPNAEQDNQQTINACLYAPSEVCPNKSFIIRVYMYLPHEQDAVDTKIKEIDSTAVKKEYKPLDLPVKEGAKLSVQLKLSEGVQCKETRKSVIWRNRYTDCSFLAKLVDPCVESIDGVAYLFVNDAPAGELLFTIDVTETQPRDLYARVEAHRFTKIFISYAHQDEMQVRGIAEGCRMLGKDFFFDKYTLGPGERFKEKIIDYINHADLFVLCWSKNAAESEWVGIEREHALQLINNGNSSLTIYPLCLRPEAPLPPDMSDTYHFGTL